MATPSPFLTVAVGGEIEADRAEIRRAVGILFAPGEWRELRALPSGKGVVVSGDDPDAATSAAHGLADGMVYFSLNPIRADAQRASKRTVVGRKWLLIDVDPIRPPDSSSTDAEKAAAAKVANAAIDHLVDLGWPLPVMIDSGNGWHLLYRIDLPADALSQQVIKTVTYALADSHDSPTAIIDRATHDAPRIAKLPGTWARKGPDTADRPHRPCRIVYVPDSLEVVTVDQLRALVGPSPAGSAPAAPFATTACDGPGKTAYVRRAVEAEVLRVALAPVSERNETLNRAAFALGQFDHPTWPEFDPRWARDQLRCAAERAGLTAGEIGKTITSGWEAGKKDPRPRPVEATQDKPAAKQLSILTRGLEEIKPTTVDWLWENVIAIGFISIFAGRTGMGKSMVLCDLAARLSRGEAPAFSSCRRGPCRTLFISEDPQEQMLAPRLLEAGTVLRCPEGKSYVRLMTFEAMGQFTLDNLDMLQRAYVECSEPTLVIIDPPSNFLGKTDEHKNAELRKVLMGLVGWINQKKIALVLLNHLNKAVGKGLDAVERIMGSVAWSTTARVTIAFDRDPDNPQQFVCGGTKNNLGRLAEPIAYQIVQGNVSGTIKWIGKTDTSMDDAVNRIKKKSRAQNAAEWLVERFRERRTWPSDDLYDLGRAAGVSRSALWEAAESLPLKREITSPQDGGKRYWQWSAHPGWPPVETLETLETLSRNPHGDKEMGSVSTSKAGQNASDGSVSSVPSVSGVSGGETDGTVDVVNRVFKPF